MAAEDVTTRLVELAKKYTAGRGGWAAELVEDPNRLDALPHAIEERLRTLRALLAEVEQANERARPYLSLAETHALQHREHRLRAEIDWHVDLLAAMPAVVRDEQSRALAPDPLPTPLP